MVKQKKRIFKRSVEQIHDLYKLEVAKTVKSRTDYSPMKEIDHVHHYHSIDSKGTPQNTSISISGHFHVLEVVTPATDTDPATLKCSLPMIWVRSKNRNGQWEKKLQLANPEDTHTHVVAYVDSHKFVPAKINPEFVKLQAMEANKIPVAEGVIER